MHNRYNVHDTKYAYAICVCKAVQSYIGFTCYVKLNGVIISSIKNWQTQYKANRNAHVWKQVIQKKKIVNKENVYVYLFTEYL